MHVALVVFSVTEWHTARQGNRAVHFTVGDSVLLSMCHIDLKGNYKFKPHLYWSFYSGFKSGFSSLLAVFACSFKACT